eukprot:12315_1
MQINRILLFITLFILTKRLKTESLGDNISCEDTILDTISDSNANDSSHLYELTINNTYNVNFDACRSNIDLVIVIFDDLDNDISNSYCSNGDWCGQCDEYNNGYPENFTIPSMVSGKYVIQIEPYSAGGQYEILVNCMDPPPLSNVTSSPSNINITCSDTISNSIDFPESQYYTLMVDDYYDNINFDSCQSQADIKIIILDDTNNDISDQYCSNGDYCGSCSNIAFYAENFTIPMFTSGKYYIHIQTFQSFASSNQYQVKINCISNDNVISTSAPVILHSEADCDFYTNHSHVISPSQNLSDSIIIKDSTIEIEFDIKLNTYCDLPLCNILFIGNKVEFPSLWVNGEKNYFLIKTSDNSTFNDVYTVPNANNILPVDNYYHHMYISYTPHQRLFKIDNVIYYSAEYDMKPVLSSPTGKHTLYASRSLSNAINGTLKNICVKSTGIHINGAMHCGESYNAKLSSSLDIDYYYFKLFHNASSVLFDSCASSYDTFLSLYDMNFTLLFQADNGGNCGIKVQLITSFLKAGQYILAISGSGNEYHHAHGQWGIKIKCVFENINNTALTLLDQYTTLYLQTDWRNAEAHCEQTLGTTLATIVTTDDMIQAIRSITDFFWNINAENLNEPIWTGMYRDPMNGSKWQWVDGTVLMAFSDYKWHKNQPDLKPDFRQIAAVMYLFNNETSSFLYDHEFQNNDGYGGWTICNAPNAKYSVVNCTKSIQCWKDTSCCKNTILNKDIAIQIPFNGRIDVPFAPPIAYWNERLFLFGIEQLYYTHFQLFTHEGYWNRTFYNVYNLSGYIYSQRYAQYMSSMYLYYENQEATQEVLIQMNLNDLSM